MTFAIPVTGAFAGFGGAVAWVLGLPAYVNVNGVEMMQTCQAPGPPAVKRAS